MGVAGEGPAERRVPQEEIPTYGASRAPSPWPLSLRVGFRFCFVYFGLYLLTSQVARWSFAVPGWVPALPGSGLLESVVSWVAVALLGFEAPLEMIVASGDRPYDWAHALLLLTVAGGATLVWSLLDRTSLDHRTLHRWFHLGVRFGLGAILVTYGAAKLVPLQMPYPDLARLLQPFGSFSPMGVLWSSIGAAPGYQSFTGALELTAGILLFVPRLALLGALLAFGVAVQVFALNMTYDVPVKLFSFHLILMSLVLLAPDARRLASVLVLDRPAPAPDRPPLLRSPRARNALLVGQLGLGAWVVGMHVSSNVGTWLDRPAWLETRAGQADDPFYGIWNVESMWIDGELRPPLLTDEDRWRRLVLQGSTIAAIQHMDDRFTRLPAGVAEEEGRLWLGADSADPADGGGRFSFDRPDPDRLVLDGDWNGQPVRVALERMDRESFLLLQIRFRWVQDLPFNR